MRLNNFRVPTVIAGLFLVTSSITAPAIADANFDRYFASRVNTQKDWAQNWEVRFVPTDNSYVYQIQVAGKGRGNDGKELACHKFAAQDYQRLTVGQVKADIGVENPKAFNAKFGADGNVIDVYGGKYNRWVYPVYSQVHLRVVAYNQSGKELYKTGWYGAPDQDIVTWKWPSQCSWVKG